MRYKVLDSQYVNFISDQIFEQDLDVETIDQTVFNVLVEALSNYFNLSIREAQKNVIEALKSLYGRNTSRIAG